MITRFDHVVIGVPDVASAVKNFSALGFDVAAGGKHPSLGTGNAIIRFGLDYIELLAVEDMAQAHARGPFGAELADYLQNHTGLCGFVLASANLDDEAAGLSEIGIPSEGPFAMDRERPDGRVLAWRLVLPGSSPWRKPWPFLIEWETPDAQRLQWDVPGQHNNGAQGVAGLELLVNDLNQAKALYETAFDLSATNHSNEEVTYKLGKFTLSVRTPKTAGEADELSTQGPGPFRLILRGNHNQDLDPADAFGARIRFID